MKLTGGRAARKSAQKFLLRLLGWQISKVLWRIRYFFARFPEVVVVSGGGCGTTTLIAHLSVYMRTNLLFDGDGLKHARRIPRGFQAQKSLIVYIRGDIESQIRSLRRRDSLRLQAAKLGGLRGIFVSPKNLAEFIASEIAKQQEIFELAADPRVMVVDFPAIFIDASELERFLGLEGTKFARTMPALRARRTESKSDGSC